MPYGRGSPERKHCSLRADGQRLWAPCPAVSSFSPPCSELFRGVNPLSSSMWLLAGPRPASGRKTSVAVSNCSTAAPMCVLQPVPVTDFSLHSPSTPGAGVGIKCLHVHCYHHPAMRAVMPDLDACLSRRAQYSDRDPFLRPSFPC